jgi:hypothetical protein
MALEPLIQRGLLEVGTHEISCWHRLSPRGALIGYLFSAGSVYAIFEILVSALRITSGPGLNILLLRIGFAIITSVALLPLFSPRRARFVRENPIVVIQPLILGRVALPQRTVSLQRYNILEVDDPPPLQRLLLPLFGRLGVGARLKLVGMDGEIGPEIIAGPREAVVALAQWLALRHPRVHIRVEF